MEQQVNQSTAAVTSSLNSTLDLYGDSDEFLVQVANHPLSQAAAWVYRLRLFFIFVPGSFGNIMILVIQRRIGRRLKDSVLSVLMSALAVSDLTMLSCVTWIYGLYFYGIDLYSLHEILCRGLFFLVFASGTTSAWFLVSMTTHRAVTILWPHRASSVCTTLRARWCVFAIAFITALIYSHILYGRAMKETPNGAKVCSFVSEEYSTFLYHTFWWVSLTISSAIPFVLLIVSNSAIIYRVSQSLRQAREKLVTGSTNQLKEREAKASSMNVTLVCASLAFLVLTMPLMLAILLRELSDVYQASSVKSRALSLLIDAVADTAFITNNSVNFYIYALTGSKYRAELAVMFRCGKKDNDPRVKSTGPAIPQ